MRRRRRRNQHIFAPTPLCDFPRRLISFAHISGTPARVLPQPIPHRRSPRPALLLFRSWRRILLQSRDMLLIRLCVGGVMMLALGCAASPAKSPPASRPGVEYLRRLHQAIEFTRGQMPAIMASAQTAARNVSRGGRIYAAGSQWDFVHELLTRAGGLQGIDFIPTSSAQLRGGDVVLYAARSTLAARELVQISGYREAGAYVIAFASTRQSDLRYFRPDVLIDSGPEPGLLLDNGKIVPIDSVVNVINAWTWTGEFIAACTRLGKMPVIYQSYHLPSGRNRAAKYTGSMFHADVKIAPIKPGLLGLAYLEQVEQSLDAIAHESA